MLMTHMNRARFKAIEEARGFILRDDANSGTALLVTPEILDSFNHRLPKVIKSPIVFMDFNKEKPLLIPKCQYQSDVYISQSIVHGLCAKGFGGDLILSNSEMHLKKDMPVPKGIVKMDSETFTNYRLWRRLSELKSNSIIKLTDIESLRKELVSVYKKAPKMSLTGYLDWANIPWDKDGSRILIKEDLYLHGPYPYDFPEELSIEGDLLIFDEAAYDLPKKLTLTGEISIRGTL